jgi:hypothetical protein
LTPDQYKKVVLEYLTFVLGELSRPLAGIPSNATDGLCFRDWIDAADWSILIEAGLDGLATSIFEDWVDEKPSRKQAVWKVAYFRQVILPALRSEHLERRRRQ